MLVWVFMQVILGHVFPSYRMFGQLSAMLEGVGLNEAYLTNATVEAWVEEEVEMARATMNIDASAGELLSLDSEARLVEFFRNTLVRQSIPSGVLIPDEWNGVVWEPGWSRPDKVLLVLNQFVRFKARRSDVFELKDGIVVKEEEETWVQMIDPIFNLPSVRDTNYGPPILVNRTDVLDYLSANHEHISWSSMDKEFVLDSFPLHPVKPHMLSSSDSDGTVLLNIIRYNILTDSV